MSVINEVKSPLRYPGGKSRAVKTLFEYIPEGTKEMCSPFFGGGSFEIYCIQRGIRVYAYDNFQPLVDFWQCLLENPTELADQVEKFRPLSKDDFYKLQKIHLDLKDKLERATLFYVLNRTSFSGSTLSGGMASGGVDNNPRFTQSSIDRIRNFEIENLTVELDDFKESIVKHKNTLLYLDPPYLIKSKLYGNRGDLQENFEHNELVDILKKRDNWILSYNNGSEVKEMYKEFQIEPIEWTYGMSNDKSSKEILILSNDIAKYRSTRLSH